MKMTSTSSLPVAVIGAGPVGLAAAAELTGRDIPVIVLEAGAEVGENIRQWAHVRMFSPWRYNIARSARSLLEGTNWTPPDAEAIPTGGEILRDFLLPLSRLPAIRHALHLETRVTAISRLGLDKLSTADRAERPFLLRVMRDGREEDILARAVIDCSGTYTRPNHGGAHGLPARGEMRYQSAIAYGMPDVSGAERQRYIGKRVAVLGAGHSAIGVMLDLLSLKQDDPETRIIWLSRRADLRLAYGGGDADGLPERGALGSRLKEAVEASGIAAIHPFALDEIERDADGLRLTGTDGTMIMADELIVATGFRPDLAMLGELRLDLDPALESPRLLAPLIDPNVHSCGSVRPHGARELAQPEPGFYLAGMKSYGRAPTFLLATGYEQVRSIVAEIAGDHVAAARIELELPETGVCFTDLQTAPKASSCCDGPAKVAAEACCVADETAKAEGKAGCGCGTQKAIIPESMPARTGCC
jgi:thioredoxin reductase